DANASPVPTLRRSDPHAGSVLLGLRHASVRPRSAAPARHAWRGVLRDRSPHFPSVVPDQRGPDFSARPRGRSRPRVLVPRHRHEGREESLFVVTAILSVLATIVGLLLR